MSSDARIRAALPSIEYTLNAGACLVLCSHLGRPKGRPTPELSLEPVGARLSELIGVDVVFADDCVGDGVRAVLKDLRPGRVLLLENLRFHPGETNNDPKFTSALVAGFDLRVDVYVNDAFGVSHREHASVVGVPRRFERRAAGLLLEREAKALGTLTRDAKRPFVAVVGGAKVSDKLGVLAALLPRIDVLCIGGAMAYTFLKAMDVSIGASAWEDTKLAAARELLQRADTHQVEVLLPEDHVAAAAFFEDAEPQTIARRDIPDAVMGLDIGPVTRKRMAERIATAKTVFWNGPMGVFEWPSFAAGTRAVAAAVASCEGHTVVGGGDSVAALEDAGVVNKIDHVSTGGGASLELLRLGSLPGLEILKSKERPPTASP